MELGQLNLKHLGIMSLYTGFSLMNIYIYTRIYQIGVCILPCITCRSGSISLCLLSIYSLCFLPASSHLHLCCPPGRFQGVNTLTLEQQKALAADTQHSIYQSMYCSFT